MMAMIINQSSEFVRLVVRRLDAAIVEFKEVVD
jgi:hypothetical protein